MRTIDLRSDTLTQPTPAMRQAMADAEVGDDVFKEDPTVAKLEEMAADRMGKQAALFVASGTMGNLTSLLTHCGRGDEIILGDQSHIFYYEQGGAAALGGIHPRTIPNNPDGTLNVSDITDAIRGEDVHFPRSRLIVLENTHNRCTGAPLTAEYTASVARLAHDRDMRLHIDGARIFNAAAALGVNVRDLARHADSISFCLSKGLAAPVGSLVCGDRQFIDQARRNRKVLGGGMRQAGILAAAGIVALNEMADRLIDDHANARRLAEGLAALPDILVNPSDVKTNIVFFDLAPGAMTPTAFVEKAGREGVRLLPLGPSRIRAVTHYHISTDDIMRALEIFQRLLRS